MLDSVKRFWPHLLVITGFVLVSLLFFNPVLKGKKLFQSDIMHYIGMSKQQKDFKAQTDSETYWTNSAFGGMPTYQLGAKYPHNYIKSLDLTLRFLPRPADYLFLYFLGFYIFLLSLKVDFKLAALGALAFGFSTYLIIILGVGHNSKAHAIAYMPLVLSGIILTFRKKYILGPIVTAIALGLEITANHYQMTYYLLLLVIVLGLVYLIDAYKNKGIPDFLKSLGLLVISAIVAVGLNATSLMATQDYVKESTRGPSEITINQDGTEKVSSSGLSKDYITEYSYGLLETFNLFIPNFMGGGSYEDVGRESETYMAYINLGATPIQALQESRRAPTYWGEQPIVEAPAYVGAVVILLFVLALFLVKGKLKWWLVCGTLFSLFLSYGKNLEFLTDFFINYVPLYNKFRAVSSIQVLLELCVPTLAVIGLSKVFDDSLKLELKREALKKSVLITAGLALIFLIFKSSLFDFVGNNDGFYRQNYGQAFVDALIDDRKTLFTVDALRSLIFVLLSAGALLLYLTKKLSKNALIPILAILILIDLVGINRRYVNEDSFVSALQVDKPYTPNTADKEILKDTTHYRVLDLSSEGRRAPARAAYFHNSLTGYHAAKLRRYNDVLEFYVMQNNMNVINMLNTKYIIVEDEQGKIFPYNNPEANGSAWFVNTLNAVETANEELLGLDSLNTKNEALISTNLFETYNLKSSYSVDSLA
ncbi:MAG: hypothetical protein HKM26_07275, partial [Winogradskyella sp.]|nr:hypothetical protein [Winogradskyella sp.]